MLTKPCRNCLNDEDVKANYWAKIKIMFKADCQCGASCHKISSCTYDAREQLWGGLSHRNGAEYLIDTLRKSEELIRARLGPQRFERLFGHYENMSLFVIHNWNSFTCFFDDPSVTITIPIGRQVHSCKNYHELGESCRAQELSFACLDSCFLQPSI
jgi:hypothetical protein